MLQSAILLCTLAMALGEFFAETFGEADWESRWIVSQAGKEGIRRGRWQISPGERWAKNATEESGLMTGEDQAFFRISASFGPYSNLGRPLIVQYQVKYDQEPNCGGAYLKVGPPLADATRFGDKSPFYIMFGPDGCGLTGRRTHLIFARKGIRAELKKQDLPYKQDGGISHLYRLTVLPNNTVHVDVDEERIYEGAMSEDWDLPDVDDLHHFEEIGYVGFDIWQLKGGTIFDNVVLTDSEAEAQKYSEQWRALHLWEMAAKASTEEASSA